MKKYIIDGYNLLKSPAINIPLNLNLEDQRNHLIRLIKSFSQFEKCEVIVVFDNSLSFKTGRSEKSGRVQIKYTKPSMEADELIKKIIRKENKTDRLIIISSDRAIQYAAKDHGATSLSSEDYCRIMEKKQISPQDRSSSTSTHEKYEPNLGEKEIQYWKRLFQDNDKNE